MRGRYVSSASFGTWAGRKGACQLGQSSLRRAGAIAENCREGEIPRASPSEFDDLTGNHPSTFGGVRPRAARGRVGHELADGSKKRSLIPIGEVLLGERCHVTRDTPQSSAE